jgi:hypothetical protein
MATQRKILRVTGILFCLHLFVIFSVGRVGATIIPAGEADALSAGCVRFVRLLSSGFLQTRGPRHSTALEPHQPQTIRTSLGCTEFFEEETDSPFNSLNGTAFHSLYDLSNRSRRPSIRMKPAARALRLYLVNSRLLC